MKTHKKAFIKVQRITGTLSRMSIQDVSRMSIIFSSDAGNVIFKCIFWWQRGGLLSFRDGEVGLISCLSEKEIPSLPSVQKKNFYVFFEKNHLSFSINRKNIIFSRKRNAIFPDDIRKIIFQWNFLERPFFQNIWTKKIWLFVE